MKKIEHFRGGAGVWKSSMMKMCSVCDAKRSSTRREWKRNRFLHLCGGAHLCSRYTITTKQQQKQDDAEGHYDVRAQKV